jgi:cellulose synthase/poly-beta-1,6-N-acetylglucosamine synthase-like glycosyltransferase
LDRIRGGGYDAIAVFDADNEADRSWFKEMDAELRSGAHVVTGHRMSSNPFANIITGWYTLYWNLMNELSNRVRSNLKLSSMLTGTGFCFRTSVLPAEGWRTRTFVEDLEFAFFRNLDGYQVRYAENAVFYDEQPVSVRPMLRQLNRWATGGMQILLLYGWRWIRELCRRPSLRLFDCFAVIALGVTGSLLMLLNAAMLNWRFGLWFLAFAWTSAVLSTALSRYSIRALLVPIVTFPVFAVILSCTVVYSEFFPQRTWKPIEHGN